MKSMTAKPLVRGVLVAACVVLGSTAHAQNRELGSTGVLLDGVAAVVDEGIVLKSEVQEAVDVAVQNFMIEQARLPPNQRQPLPPRSAIEEQALEALVLREIQYQQALDRGVEISDTDLNEVLAAIAQENGYTLEELPTVLSASGVDYAAFREAQRKDLMVETLRRAVLRDRLSGSITDREIERCLAQSAASQANEFEYNISHILIGVSQSATPDELARARAKAEAIRERVMAGEDFASIAVTESDAQQTALAGGSLGWRKGLEVPTMFADVVRRLEPGEVSEPIQTSSGFQIVRLNEMRGAERLMTEQREVRHILLRPTEIMDDAAVQQRLLGIREQLVSGEAEFGPTARSITDDAGSAPDGGYLGWLSQGETVPEFEEAIWALPLDTISEPIQTRYGWHLVEVTGERTHDLTDERRREDCLDRLTRARADEEEQLWARELRDAAYIDVRL